LSSIDHVAITKTWNISLVLSSYWSWFSIMLIALHVQHWYSVNFMINCVYLNIEGKDILLPKMTWIPIIVAIIGSPRCSLLTKCWTWFSWQYAYPTRLSSLLQKCYFQLSWLGLKDNYHLNIPIPSSMSTIDTSILVSFKFSSFCLK